MTAVIGDAGNQIRIDAIAAIGEHRVSGHHLHGSHGTRAQGHGEVGRLLVGIETKLGDPVLRELGARGLQDANRHHVLRACQTGAHRHGAIVFAVVILWLPRLSAGDTGAEEQRRVVHDGRGREAFFQRGRIDERLEAGARLAPRLGHVVKLVLVEVKPADQGLDRAGTRIGRHKGAFHFGQLRDFPALLGCTDDANNRTAAQLDVGRGLVAQARLNGLQAIAGHGDGFAIGPGHDDFPGRGFEHHGGQHVAVVGVIGKCVVDHVFGFTGIGGQIDESLRATILLAALVIHDALAQRDIGGFLVAGIERGVDVEATRIGLVAVLREDHLAHHFGHVFGVHARVVRAGAQLQVFLLGLCRLFGGDVAGVMHALDDVELTRTSALGVADRVVGGRGLRQTREHGGFGDADRFERLAKVCFAGCREAVGAISQIDLVHVDLENLVLAQQMLEFEGQQNFVDLAGEGLLGGEVHIARHLHGDGGGALALDLAEVGQRSAHHPLVVHAAMFEETGIFDSEDRIFHHIRDFIDGSQISTLFAEFAQQGSFLRINPKRELGSIVCQLGNIGQIWIGHGQPNADHDCPGHRTSGGHSEDPRKDAQNPGKHGAARLWRG